MVSESLGTDVPFPPAHQKESSNCQLNFSFLPRKKQILLGKAVMAKSDWVWRRSIIYFWWEKEFEMTSVEQL